jgi:hypothetical protein
MMLRCDHKTIEAEFISKSFGTERKYRKSLKYRDRRRVKVEDKVALKLPDDVVYCLGG